MTKLERSVINLCKFIATTIALALWCSVGLAVWLAVISRTIAAVTLHMMIALVSGGQVDNSGRAIEGAAVMWPRGIHLIVDTLWYGKRQDASHYAHTHSYQRALGEMCFAIVLYMMVLLVLFDQFVPLMAALFTEEGALVLAMLIILIVTGYVIYRRIAKPSGTATRPPPKSNNATHADPEKKASAAMEDKDTVSQGTTANADDHMKAESASKTASN